MLSLCWHVFVIPNKSRDALFPFRMVQSPGVVVVVVGGGGVGEGTWVNFCWIFAVGLSEPLPHNSLLCGHIIDPILVTFGKK